MAGLHLKAIETIYPWPNGYRFRSRLEARYAVFFDALNVSYEYEKEGYNLDSAGWYLPDFWLPNARVWYEIKPEDFTPAEEAKCRALYQVTGYPVMQAIGVPATYEDLAVTLSGAGAPSRSVSNDAMLRQLFSYYGYKSHPAQFRQTYNNAVRAARQARFEHGEHGL